MGIKPKYTECKPPLWSKGQKKAYSWCIKNGIYISAVAAGPGMHIKSWYVQVVVNGKKVMSPKTYGPDDLYNKILELYKFYYDKNVQQ